jgi:hypothetical protein
MGNRPHLEPYGRPMPRAQWGCSGVGRFFMSEMLLYPIQVELALERFERGPGTPKAAFMQKGSTRGPLTGPCAWAPFWSY